MSARPGITSAECQLNKPKPNQNCCPLLNSAKVSPCTKSSRTAIWTSAASYPPSSTTVIRVSTATFSMELDAKTRSLYVIYSSIGRIVRLVRNTKLYLVARRYRQDYRLHLNRGTLYRPTHQVHRQVGLQAIELRDRGH